MMTKEEILKKHSEEAAGCKVTYNKSHKGIIKAMQEYSDQENASLISLIKEMAGALDGYNKWEADIIMEDKLWQPNRAQDVLRGPIYDTMMELQELRNAVMAKYKALMEGQSK